MFEEIPSPNVSVLNGYRVTNLLQILFQHSHFESNILAGDDDASSNRIIRVNINM